MPVSMNYGGPSFAAIPARSGIQKNAQAIPTDSTRFSGIATAATPARKANFDLLGIITAPLSWGWGIISGLLSYLPFVGKFFG